MSIAQRVLANPGKFSLEQLQQGMQAGSIPAYIAIPLIQEKVAERKRQEAMARAAGAPARNTPTVAEEVLAQAAPAQPGVTALPSGLPTQMAGGGIVAFEEGGEVERYQSKGLVQPDIYPYNSPYAGRFSYREALENDPLLQANPPMTEEERRAQIRRDRAAFAKPYAMAADVLAGPYNYLASRGSDVANLVGIPRLGRALGIYHPDVTSVEIPKIGPGGDRPFNTMLERYAATAPTEAQPTGKKEEATAPAAPAAPAAEAAPAAKPGGGIYDLVQPRGQFIAPPRMQSMEDVTRRQLYGTETEPGFLARSEARSQTLMEELGKNKLEGKAFEGLESDLKKEAEQAGAERADAKNLAFLKAGLAMMAGTSRHALENIGKGAMTGLEDYNAAVKDLKKAEKERQRQMAFIEQARRAEDQDNLKRRDSLLEKANAAAERRDEYGTSALINATGKDQGNELEIWKTQYSGDKALQVAGIGAQATLGAAKMRMDALANRGAGITPYQLAQLRANAEKMVDPDAVRAELAKSLQLAKAPAPGANKMFDEKVAALLANKIDEVVARRLGGAPGANSPLSQYIGFKNLGVETEE